MLKKIEAVLSVIWEDNHNTMASMNTEIKDFISTMTAVAKDLQEKAHQKEEDQYERVCWEKTFVLAQMRPDSRDKEIGELIRKRATDAKIIALLKEQLKDYKQNGADAEELDELLQAREEEAVEAVCCGGDQEDRWQEIIDEGREQVFDEVKEWLNKKCW